MPWHLRVVPTSRAACAASDRCPRFQRLSESTANLRVNLENPLPAPQPVGSGTAVFCYGTCFHRYESIKMLEIVVDGIQRHAVAAHGMPRPDIFHMLHPRLDARPSHRRDPDSEEDPEMRSYRSGFWATVPITGRDRPGNVELAVAARLASGREETALLGSFQIVDPRPPRSYGRRFDSDRIAICMATYEPDITLFQAQINSLRAQTDDRWICFISDDCTSPKRFERMQELLADDPRFVVSRAEKRAKFYRNFERALAMAPAEAELLALCDQDDRWYPEKLEVLRGALGSAGLVYSDQRLVDARGRVLRETMWKGRSNNHTDIAALLTANTITGAACLFRREVARLALPFPETPGMQFHDHWLGLIALAAGDIAYVDRPLYDYVQHSGAIFGEVAPGADQQDRTARRPRPSAKALADRLRGGRGAYFLGYLPRDAQARTLLVRCDGRLTGPNRRALKRFISAARSPLAFAWLALRPLRSLVGRNETLGSETELVHGILWRWFVAIASKGARTPGRRPTDARYPDPYSFEQKRLRRWRARA
jgi:glycosyltransferase involved in cell wall biosynthesis